MLVLRKPYLLYLGDAVLKSDCKTAFGLRDWCREDVIGEWSHPAAKVTLDLPRLSPAEAARQGAGSIVVGVAPTGGVLPRALAGRSRGGAGGGPRRRERPAHATDVIAAAGACRGEVRHATGGRAQSGRRVPGRQRTQAHRPARADGRHRLCARQEVHGAGAHARAAGERRGGDVPRDRPDRHHDRGQRHSDGCAGRGLSRRRGRGALAGQRSRALGRDRRPGLAVPSRVCRGDPRPAARLAAGRDRAVPRPRARDDRGVPRLPDPAAAAGDRRLSPRRAADQPEHPLRGREHQLLHARRRRVASATARNSSASCSCRSAIRCAAASSRSRRHCGPDDRGRDPHRTLGADRAVRHGARCEHARAGAGRAAGRCRRTARLGRGRRRRLRRGDARIDGRAGRRRAQRTARSVDRFATARPAAGRRRAQRARLRAVGPAGEGSRACPPGSWPGCLRRIR